LLKTVLRKPAKSDEADDAPVQWALSRVLGCVALMQGTFAIGGRLLDRLFRTEYAETSHAYISQLILLARADLGLSAPVKVVLLNRSLMRRLQAQAGVLGATDTSVIDMLHRLVVLLDVGWHAPAAAFWACYAVPSDEPEIARHWVDTDTVNTLTTWPESVASTQMYPSRWRAEVLDAHERRGAHHRP
jgi:hypothetical protein